MFVPITPHRPSSSHDVSNIHLLEKKNQDRISSFAQGHVAKDDAWPVVRQAHVANHKRGKKNKNKRGQRRPPQRECVKGEREEEEEEEEWRGEEWRGMEASTTNGSRGAGECGQTWEMIRLALRSQEAAISGARHT